MRAMAFISRDGEYVVFGFEVWWVQHVVYMEWIHSGLWLKTSCAEILTAMVASSQNAIIEVI